MLSPNKVKVAVETTVVLPKRVRVNGIDQDVDKSLALLHKLGISMLTSDTEMMEEGFATFLLPPQWTAEPEKKFPWTVIADSADKDVLLVFTAKTARNRPYISIVS